MRKRKRDFFIRLLNAEKYEDELKDAVYRILGDVALVLYMKVSEQDDCITSTKIRQSIVKKWNRDCDTVIKEALVNTYLMSPPRIYRWEQMIFDPEYEGENFMDLTGIHELKKDAMGNCLSTSKNDKWCSGCIFAGSGRKIGGTSGVGLLYGIYQYSRSNDP